MAVYNNSIYIFKIPLNCEQFCSVSLLSQLQSHLEEASCFLSVLPSILIYYDH